MPIRGKIEIENDIMFDIHQTNFEIAHPLHKMAKGRDYFKPDFLPNPKG